MKFEQQSGNILNSQMDGKLVIPKATNSISWKFLLPPHKPLAVKSEKDNLMGNGEPDS